MDYKSKLQTNNTTFRENNTDLQAILNTINSLPSAGNTEVINLDAEITEQEGLIDQIQTALEGKAVGDGGSSKTTKTIYVDWTEDYERLCEIHYISNGEIVGMSYGMGVETIEAEGGIIHVSAPEIDYTSNFIEFYSDVLVAKQDGETVYLKATGEL